MKNRMVRIEAGMSHADEKMTAGFATAGKEAKRQIAMIKEAMTTAQDQVSQTMTKHKEDANDEMKEAQESLNTAMIRNRNRVQRISAEIRLLL